MQITWLGQAGLRFVCGDTTVIVDPYLSDSVAKVQPANARRVPVDARFLAAVPDILLFTHDHLDHYDPETADVYLSMPHRMTVLAPASVWPKARAYGGDKNYVRFDRGTTWTEGGLRFRAVRAEHSDDHAIGVIIEDISDGRRYYVTGDTLYNEAIFAGLPRDIHAVFLPINGVGNNMNAADAADFARRIGAKYAVPLHWGLFDALDPHSFDFAGRIIPSFYQEIIIPE